MKKLYLFCLAAAACLQASAQDDSLLMQLENNTPQPRQYISNTFKGTRLINMSTNEISGKRTLDFRISHRFGEFNTGIDNFYGLDGPASITLSFDYSFDGRFQVGIGRSSVQKLYDGNLKYALFRQTVDNKMPVSVTLYAKGNMTSEDDPMKNITGRDMYDKFLHRCSGMAQVIVARKFNRSISFQVSPTYIHYNLVQKSTDKNDIYALGFAGRVKVSKRIAITGEYVARLNKYTDNFDNYYNSASIGIDIETGGHVFQVFVTNSFAINEVQYIPYTSTSWKDGGIRLGFNISRVFTL